MELRLQHSHKDIDRTEKRKSDLIFSAAKRSERCKARLQKNQLTE